MKPITFFTTFNDYGFKLYGEEWLDSIIGNVLDKTDNIDAVVYAENPKFVINHPKVKILNFHRQINQHTAWKKQYSRFCKLPPLKKTMTIRFSHKAFVITDFILTNTTGYGIWADGDVIFKACDYNDFPNMLFTNNECLACQIETEEHVETGLIIFDLENTELLNFIRNYKENYSIRNITKLKLTYDGHIFAKTISDMEGLNFYDLNHQYGIKGIQNTSEATFLHPEIKKRFTHNIDIDGKSKYKDWTRLKYLDPVFMLLNKNNPLTLTDEEISTLERLKMKRTK